MFQTSQSPPKKNRHPPIQDIIMSVILLTSPKFKTVMFHREGRQKRNYVELCDKKNKNTTQHPSNSNMYIHSYHKLHVNVCINYRTKILTTCTTHVSYHVNLMLKLVSVANFHFQDGLTSNLCVWKLNYIFFDVNSSFSERGRRV